MNKSIAIFCAISLWLAGTALAQGAGPGSGPGKGMRVEQLIKNLGLDKETADRLLPLLTANRQERQAQQEKMEKAVEALAKEAKNDNTDPARLNAAIDELEKTRAEFNTLRDRHHAKIKEILGVTKYARYLAFEEGWKGQMKARLDQRPGMGRRMGRGMGHPGTIPPATTATPSPGAK